MQVGIKTCMYNTFMAALVSAPKADYLEGCTGKKQGCRLGKKHRVHDRLARHIQSKERMTETSTPNP